MDTIAYNGIMKPVVCSFGTGIELTGGYREREIGS